MIYNVATAAELTSALGQAKAGDTLRLAAGDYGTYTIKNRPFAGEVRIESADPKSPAHFERLTVQGVTNLALAHLDVGRALAAGEPDHLYLTSIRDSQNISLSGVKIHGSLDDNPQNDGRGLVIVNVRGMLVEDSVFTELNRAIVGGSNYNLVLRNNEFKTIRSDGMQLSTSDGVVISGNRFSDFRPISVDHSDAIQFTGAGIGVDNVTIENNQILITNGEGGNFFGSQGIFISDAPEQNYHNILIRNNLIYSNGAFHGINVDGARHLQITGNSVLSQRVDTKSYWIQIGDSDGVVLTNNVADTFIFKNVARLFQSENVNLSLFPDLVSQIPNVNSPDIAADLVFPGHGFVETVALEGAPVSSALASALSNSIRPSQSQQAFKPVPVADESGAVAAGCAHIFGPVAQEQPSLPLASELDPAMRFGAPVWGNLDLIGGHHFAIA